MFMSLDHVHNQTPLTEDTARQGTTSWCPLTAGSVWHLGEHRQRVDGNGGELWRCTRGP